jgi:hypothetical protein
MANTDMQEFRNTVSEIVVLAARCANLENLSKVLNKKSNDVPFEEFSFSEFNKISQEPLKGILAKHHISEDQLDSGIHQSADLNAVS